MKWNAKNDDVHSNSYILLAVVGQANSAGRIWDCNVVISICVDKRSRKAKIWWWCASRRKRIKIYTQRYETQDIFVEHLAKVFALNTSITRIIFIFESQKTHSLPPPKMNNYGTFWCLWELLLGPLMFAAKHTKTITQL